MNDVVQQVPQKQTSLLTLDEVSFPSFLFMEGRLRLSKRALLTYIFCIFLKDVSL